MELNWERGDYGDDANNYSIGIILQHGDNRFLFTGDAKEEAEADMLQNGIDLSADVYQVGHHGSSTSSSKAFLDQVEPKYAVISCEEGNSYGHPHAEVMNSLRARGIEVFRTDEQGTILAESDGTSITWNCAPSTSWKSGEPTGSADASGGDTPAVEEKPIVPVAPVVESSEFTYIININTEKFHYASCSSVNDMNESNKLPSNQSRDEIIAQGYVPCKRCNP